MIPKLHSNFLTIVILISLPSSTLDQPQGGPERVSPLDLFPHVLEFFEIVGSEPVKFPPAVPPQPGRDYPQRVDPVIELPKRDPNLSGGGNASAKMAVRPSHRSPFLTV